MCSPCVLVVTGILDVAIVERGRNVVSSSRDGTARLWDCGKSTCLGKYAAESVINACCLDVPAASIDLLQPDQVAGIVFTVADNKRGFSRLDLRDLPQFVAVMTKGAVFVF